ncbi:MAG: elongation factor P [Elusimicrobia bacterium]|nr:elongation factor P [Elusimicrobiota bacterium]
MITPNDFREGLIFESNGRKYQVITYQHHRKSQARAKVQCKLRDMDSGSIVEEAYNSSEKFREVDVRKRDFQFLYSEGDTFHFMDQENYEQSTLKREQIGDQARFMTDNMDVIGVFFDGVFRTVEVPPNITVEISSAEPGFKGDSVSNLLKNAVTANGITVRVPLFIKEGDRIKVDTRSGEYVGRVVD